MQSEGLQAVSDGRICKPLLLSGYNPVLEDVKHQGHWTNNLPVFSALYTERSNVNLLLFRGAQECCIQAKLSTVLARSSQGPHILMEVRRKENYSKTRELKKSRPGQ